MASFCAANKWRTLSGACAPARALRAPVKLSCVFILRVQAIVLTHMPNAQEADAQ